MIVHVIECVPNFSEGRDAKKMQSIVDAIAGAGVLLLGWESDVDHNRSVALRRPPAGSRQRGGASERRRFRSGRAAF